MYCESQCLATACHAHKVVYNQVWKGVNVDTKLTEALYIGHQNMLQAQNSVRLIHNTVIIHDNS